MLSTSNKKFKHVDYLWDNKKGDLFVGKEIDLLIYRSNLLGNDLRITNYGGGNTSVKTIEVDPLTGEQVEVLWIKGSGGDLGTLTRKGLAGLYLNRLHSLKKRYKGIQQEDAMVELYNHCIFDLNSKAPSIDTPLHAFIPFKHVDHLHPDAIIAIGAAKEGERITKELYGGKLAWLPWQRPGFDLALKIEKVIHDHPGIEGIILGSHGLFTWGATSNESYFKSLEIIEKAADYIQKKQKDKNAFGKIKVQTLDEQTQKKQAVSIMPVLRKYCSSTTRMIGHFCDVPEVMEFICSEKLNQLAPMGTSCPDHFLRTKIKPLVLDLDPKNSIGQKELEKISTAFENYREEYKSYYENSKKTGSPSMRDPNPVIILWPGVGLFSFAKDKSTARIAAEFYTNAINVMKGAETISSYTALPLQEAFNIEYWELEEAKLRRMPKPKSLAGKIALVTGGSGGIGKAIAKKLADEGACLMLTDMKSDELQNFKIELDKMFGQDVSGYFNADITNKISITDLFKELILKFGGIDILVNSAGLAISKSLEETTVEDWDILQDVMVKGQFILCQQASELMCKQQLGGDIVNIVSKNALVAGANNVAYGTAKAAQLHMSRLLAAESGKDKIRVNVVNPDAVIADSKIWAGAWAEGRAKAYGIKVEELPAFYAKRTLLNEIILPEDIANACLAFVDGSLSKSTGNILNVDGGVASAFTR